MRLTCLVAALAASAVVPACAQGPAQAQAQLAPGAPKLLVVISVDQFSANLWDEYRPHFTAGFARIGSGAAFRNGYQSHAATETCPGHSTILTGDHPSRTGIIANVWTDQSVGRTDKSVYCAEDERVPGSSSSSYTVSPLHLLVPTLGELVKQRWPASRSVAVSGKDRAAVMMTGHKVDQRWYWTGQKYETDLAGVVAPAVVAKVNAAVAAALAQARPPLEPTPFCQAKARVIPIEGGGKPVGAGQLGRAAGDQAAFRASPEFDGDTLALAAGLVDEMKLGRGPAPDVLAVSLSATDYVGHTYGTEGEEMCLQLTELDREIGDFLALLDSRGIDYAVALTADHGGKDIPERERLAGVAGAVRADAGLRASVIGPKLAAQLGLQGPGLFGDIGGDIYLDRSLAPADRKRLLAAAVAAYRAHPQVEAVFTAAELAATPVPTGSPTGWTMKHRARASFYSPRSGDLVVLLKKDVTPIPDTTRYVATHGSPWDYDRRVPVLFWRKGAAPAPSEQVVETTDIMPTLAAWLGLPLAPGSVDGHCLASVAQCPAANAAATERGH
ncbi:MAG TPA: alkaline phosphatase family protein [Sphingomicrobium sp.]